MQSETASFVVSLGESPVPSRLLLTPGLAMILNNDNSASQSFNLAEGQGMFSALNGQWSKQIGRLLFLISDVRLPCF